MRNIAFTTLLLLFAASSLQAQSYLTLGGGPWRTWVNYYNPYVNDFQKWHAQTGLGFGFDFLQGKKLQPSAEAGLEFYQFNVFYNCLCGSRVTTELGMFNIRFSPGGKFQMTNKISLRLAGTIQVAGPTFGKAEYSHWIATGGRNVTNLDNKLYQTRTILNFGPEINLGYEIPLKNGSKLGIRASSFISAYGILNGKAYMPFNPHIFRTSLELSYHFAKKSL